MKTLITICFSILFVEMGFSQVIVEETDLNTVENVTYIEVTCLRKKAKTIIGYVDYGQSGGANDFSQINTSDKVAKVFSSEIAVLNFLAKNGWELKQIVPVPSGIANGVEMRYIMAKKQG
jgi:hypothetical protein